MKKLIRNLFFISACLLIFSCENEHSKYKIQKEPVIDENFYKTSLKSVEELIHKNPKYADAHYRKADILFKIKDKQAIKSLEKAIEIDGQNPEYYLLATQIHLENGELEKAFQSAVQAEKTGVSNSWLFSTLANLSWKNGDSSTAFAYMDKSISTDPKNPVNYLNIGNLFLEVKDTARALKNLNLCLSLDSTHYDALSKLVEIKIAKQQYNEASKLLSKKLKFYQPDRETQMQSAILLWKTSNVDSARNTLRDIIKQDSSNYLAYHYISSLEYQRRQYDSANFYAEKALAIKSDIKEAMLTQARIKDIKKQYYNSLAQYDKIIRLDTAYKIAREERARVLRKINYMEKSKQEERTPILPTIQPRF